MYGLEPGKCIDDKYIVEAHLGAGGMCTVFLARDRNLGRKVAIKVLHGGGTSAESRERMSREAKALCDLVHKNIVRLYHSGFVDGEIPYLAMEFVEGETLRQLLQKEQRLTGDRAIAIALQICSGMEFAHNLQTIHRDLKPENIVLCRDGSESVAKIVDFGLCKLLTGSCSATLTETGVLIGTAQYIDPELVLGHGCTFASDIYSFGCMFFEMLAGQAPFVSENMAAIFAMHLNEPFPKLEALPSDEKVPEELQELILKCTGRTPAQRYKSFSEVRQDLQQLDTSRVSRYFVSGKTERPASHRARMAVPVKLIACGLVVLLLGLAVFLGCSDAGSGILSAQAQSLLSPNESTKFLYSYVSWLLEHGRVTAAKEVISASSNSKVYNLWPAPERRKLLVQYIEAYKSVGKKEEAFELSLKLLGNLLETVRHLNRKGENADGKEKMSTLLTTGNLTDAVTYRYHVELSRDVNAEQMLESLSQSLLKMHPDEKSWKQISGVFELHDLGVSCDYPPDPLWTGVLRTSALLRQEKYLVKDHDHVDALIKLCMFTARSLSNSNRPENYDLAERFFLEVPRLAKKYDCGSSLVWNSPYIAMFYLKTGKVELAKHYFAIAHVRDSLTSNDPSVLKALEAGCTSMSSEAAQEVLDTARRKASGAE